MRAGIGSNRTASPPSKHAAGSQQGADPAQDECRNEDGAGPQEADARVFLHEEERSRGVLGEGHDLHGPIPREDEHATRRSRLRAPVDLGGVVARIPEPSPLRHLGVVVPADHHGDTVTERSHGGEGYEGQERRERPQQDRDAVTSPGDAQSPRCIVPSSTIWTSHVAATASLPTYLPPTP